MSFWILSCKELDGGIYVTRLPKSVTNPDGSVQPGVPDNWYFVGPGTNPSVAEYSGTKFVLTFTYLSHLFCRVMDISTWPPTEVVPVQTPVPYPGGAWVVSLPQDSLSLKTQSDVGFGLVAQFFKPPYLATPLLFLDPSTSTYSVTVTPLAGWAPDPPAGVTVYYRLYARAFPYTGPWVLVTDWTQSAATFPWFSFPFSNVGSLRFQLSVTWGDQFLPTDQWNPDAHAEGIPGQTYITVDSTTEVANTQEFVYESLTLDLLTSETFAYLAARQLFHSESVADSLAFGQTSGTGFSVPLVGGATLTAAMGTRQGFVQIVPGLNVAFAAYSGSITPVLVPSGDSLDFSKSYLQGATLQAVMG